MTPIADDGTTRDPDPPDVRGGVFRNWARTAGAAPAGYARPRSEAEVAELVRSVTVGGGRVKAVGAGHSWSDAACTEGTLLSLDRLRRVHGIDAVTGEVTVDAGLRLHDLCDALARAGRALPVVGSITAQSVAGALATGTHGSAPGLGNLSSGVSSFRIVAADGRVRDVDAVRDPDLFRAGRVGLGALGVITRVTLRTVPAFDLEETVEPLDFGEALRRLPTLVREEPFVKVWWLPHVARAVVFRYRPTTAPRTFSPARRALDTHVVNRWVFPGILAAGGLVPTLVPLLNRLVATAYFAPRTTVGRSDHVLTLAMPPRHDELEYALPADRAAEALDFVRTLVARERLAVDFIAELRFSAADDAFLSPAQGRDSCWLGAYAARTPDLHRYFRAVEGWCIDRGGRPHWGKRFHAAGGQLRGRYDHFADFERVRDLLDPTRTFDNVFLRRVFETRDRDGS